jgi:branched-chain amino acid transport system permease protein
MSAFIQLLFKGLEMGSVYALATLGIMLIFRTSVLTNFAQGVIGMLNAFVVSFLLTRYGWSIWLAVPVGLLTAFLTGVIVDLGVIRPAKKVSSLSKQIITMGLVIVIIGITPLFFGNLESDGARVYRFLDAGAIIILGTSIDYNIIFNIVLVMAILLSLFLIMQKTRWGLAVRATASNSQVARMMGIPTRMITMGAWAVAAMLATLSAVLYAPLFGNLNPGFMTSIQIAAFIACVFGGFQTFYGPVLAAYILGISVNMAGYYGSGFFQLFFGDRISDDFGSQWGTQIVYVLIILFILFKPLGLIGKKIVKKV